MVSTPSCSESFTMSGATKKTTAISRVSPALSRSSARRKPRMRPRPEHRGAVVGRSLTYPWRLQRPVQYGRSFHECDDIKQYDQRSKRKRNRDRPCPPGALLFLTENDSLWLLLHVITPSSVAFLTHHARIDQQHRE